MRTTTRTTTRKTPGTTARQPVRTDDLRTGRRLRAVGLVAIAAAALGSVLVATPAGSEPPSTDPCRIQIVGDQWYGSGCDDGAVRSAR